MQISKLFDLVMLQFSFIQILINSINLKNLLYKDLNRIQKNKTLIMIVSLK